MASEKFKAMVHQIVASCKDPHRLGATRLNKICWYSDTLAYRYSGKSITGETYVKRKHGPVPKSILAAIEELKAADKIHVREHSFLPGKKMRLFVALEDADRTAFATHELDIIEFVTKHVCDHHTAASISALSHDAIWEAANEGEEIPMAATLVADPAPPTEKAVAWAKSLIEKVAIKMTPPNALA